MLLLEFYCTFTSMEHQTKMLFVRFWKDGSFAELQADLQIYAFLHHNYQLYLSSHDIKMFWTERYKCYPHVHSATKMAEAALR